MDEKIIIDNGAEEMNYAEKASLTIEEIVERIDAIASDKGYLTEAIESLRLITGAPGDIAGQAKAHALGKAVEAREETNQRLIEFYTKVYNDIFGSKSPLSYKDQAINLAKTAIENGFDEESISNILDSIRHIDR